MTVGSARTDLSGAIFYQANGTLKAQSYWDSTGLTMYVNTGVARWYTGAAERMRIDSAGAIQIGGTTNAGFIDFDSTNLQLNTQRNPNTGAFVNTAKSHASIGLQGADGGSKIIFGTASANNTTSTERLRIKEDGNLLVAGLGKIMFNNTDQYIHATTVNDMDIVAGDDINLKGNFQRFFSGATEHCRLSGLNTPNWIANGTNGKLGVGTTTPTEVLTVNGNIGFTIGQEIGWIYNPGTDNNMYNYIKTANNGGVAASPLEISGSNWTSGNTAGVKFTHSHGGDLMTIMTHGDVGIGTTTPTSKLDISDAVDRVMNANGEGQFEITGSGYTFGIAMGATTTALYHNSSGRSLSLGTNETERLTILGGGEVGIGTTSPSYKLTVADSTANGRAIQAVQSATSGTNWGFQGGAFGVGASKNIGLQVTAEGASTNYAALFEGGNVGIGTTSPDSLLQLESSANPDVELKISNTATVIPGNNFGGSKVRLIQTL